MKHKECLESQIREQYGKMVYSYTCHWEEIGLLSKVNKRVKNGEIVLTAITATGTIGFLITNCNGAAIVGAIFSAMALALSLYSRENNLEAKIASHQKTADELWMIREQYISLLTDFCILNENTICEKRDILTDQLSEIYKNAIPTSKKAYENAQKALKENQYQLFSTEEINDMIHSSIQK